MAPVKRKRKAARAVRLPTPTGEARFMRNWARTTLNDTPLATEVRSASASSHAYNWNCLTEIQQRTENQVAYACKVELVMRDHEAVVCEHLDSLESNDYAVIAMAWLTETAMLDSLLKARKRGVFIQIVIQKERWLKTRPALLEKFKQLGKNTFLKTSMPFIGKDSVILGSTKRFRGKTVTIDAVRVFGEGKDSEMRPLMHHKMCVMGRMTRDAHGVGKMSPGRVVLGSFNWSRRSTRSLENFTIIHSNAIAGMAQQHLSSVLRESEPLAFTSLSKSMACSFDIK